MSDNSLLNPTLFKKTCSKCHEVVRYRDKKFPDFLCTRCKNGGNYYNKNFRKLAETLKNGAKCGICEDIIRLHIHHKNGDKTDDRLKNLIILCQQCHMSIHGHKLKMPVGVRWGQFGKRLIYK